MIYIYYIIFIISTAVAMKCSFIYILHYAPLNRWTTILTFSGNSFWTNY